MDTAINSSPIKFSDIRRMYVRVDAELSKEKPNQDIVDLFEGGKSPRLAAYKNYTAMKSLTKRVKAADDVDARKLGDELTAKLQSRLKTAKYTGIAVVAGLGLALVGGILHNTGALDLGTVGQMLHQSMEFIAGTGSLLPAAFGAAMKLSMNGLKNDRNHLVPRPN